MLAGRSARPSYRAQEVPSTPVHPRAEPRGLEQVQVLATLRAVTDLLRVPVSAYLYQRKTSDFYFYYIVLVSRHTERNVLKKVTL